MRRPALVLLLVAACGCAGIPARETGDSKPRDLVWRGEVRIDQDLVLPRGSRLVLEPGTVVRFGFRDDDGDGWGDTSLRVEGALLARGTPEAPVVFTSAVEGAEPGQWGELRVDYGTFDLRYTVIEGSTRGLHAHFSSGRVEDSVFRRNVDGTRLGESTVSVEHCLFADQVGKGYNARRCRATVRRNCFRGNRSGLFLFEADSGSVFEHNVFRDNEAAFRLGDFFSGTVRADRNDWGPSVPPETSPDTGPEARLLATSGEASGSGPRRWPFWQPAWQVPLSGYVDAAPVLSDEGVYAVSWSGVLARVGLLDGSVLIRAQLPDASDTAPALGPGLLALQSWDRSIQLLRRGALSPLDSLREESSPADDHRQSSPVLRGTQLFAATWAGRVRAFDVSKGTLSPAWEFRAEGPFRADLSLEGERLLAPCQDGKLYALDSASGRLLWSLDAGAPLLSGAASDGQTVFLADRSGRLRAVDTAKGKERWGVDLGAPVWYAPPLLLADGLFQGDDAGRLSRFDPATGRLVWSRSLGAGIRSRPALVTDNGLAVGTAGGRIYLLDPATGRQWDSYSVGGPIFSSPTTAGTRVLFGSRDGSLHAVDVRLNDASR